MPLQFFTIPVLEPQAATAELNQFLATHRVWSVDQRLIEVGLQSVWTVCVTYGDPPSDRGRSPSRSPPSSEARIDYRDVLSETQFALFARLRKLRKTLAEAGQVPAYAVATNEQLATMVRQDVHTLGQLAEIPGLGETRVAKYGPRLLEELNAARHAATAVANSPAGATLPAGKAQHGAQ
jgi:superfamily II DNA helicase RecQ